MKIDGRGGGGVRGRWRRKNNRGRKGGVGKEGGGKIMGGGERGGGVQRWVVVGWFLGEGED